MIPRLYSAAFDSVRQAEGWGTTAGREALVGRLRLACLLAGEVVLTDTQVLDGTMLLDLGPAGVRELLGAAPSAVGLERVVVAARNADLGQALLEMLRDRGSSKVKGFLFSSLALNDAERRALAARMARRSYPALCSRAERVGPVRAVAELLASCGASEPAVERAAEDWRAWISAAARGRATVRPWGPPPSWADLLKSAPVDELKELLNSRELEVLRDWRNRDFDRTAFYSEQVSPQLRAWYDDVYHRGAAVQHGAGYIAMVDVSGGSDADAVEKAVALARATRSSAAPVYLPGDVIKGRGEMPGAVFEAARYACRDGVDAWLRGRPEGMRRVAYSLDRALEQPDPQDERREALVVLGVGAAAAVAAAAVAAFELSGTTAAILGLSGTALAFAGGGLRDLILLRRTAEGRLAGLVDVSGVSA